MNILPKKSWHVRTKQNIARVRRDEAKAAEEEKETQRRIALAAQEARTALLRERASQRLAGSSFSSRDQPEEDGGEASCAPKPEGIPPPEEDRFGIPLGSLKDVVQPDGHVNFFQDVEAGKRQGGTTNEEYEEEKKKEQDDYEKKIGYLVFLGQDSVEQTKALPWYSKIGHRKEDTAVIAKEVEKQKELDSAAGRVGGLEEKSKEATVEDLKAAKFKSFLDPLKDMRKYLSLPGMKSISSNKSSTSKKRRLSPSPPPPPKKKRRLEEVEEVKHKKKKKKSKHSKKSKKHHKKPSKKRVSSESSSGSEGEEVDEERQKRAKLEKLRQERLEREREERRRADKVLRKLRGEGGDEEVTSAKQLERDKAIPTMHTVKQKYNSQFNPHLARQNFD